MLMRSDDNDTGTAEPGARIQRNPPARRTMFKIGLIFRARLATIGICDDEWVHRSQTTYHGMMTTDNVKLVKLRIKSLAEYEVSVSDLYVGL